MNEEDYKEGLLTALKLIRLQYNYWLEYKLVTPSVTQFCNELSHRIKVLRKR